MSDYGPDDEIVHGGPVPVYVQIAGVLRARIQRGDWQPMRPLPGEQRLADEFGVARMTARKAVRVLADEGTVFVVPQRGAFVSAPGNPAPDA
ncbi:putative GntR family transcriptional regulator [Streptomyces sp. NBRC 110611]|uniref:GntR family transcriptional regulator n=1 Tax=Streptomyces sp. NBRC 110611 TaxID=1621259 RepID=UPI00085677DE|nr:GntR family transcriptional regulator [Streptomyces sp. NBRC 110611]GAU66641.1 putative GntR family transcriptional regulator [Streptomyces sp. NBRC 110611]